MLCWEKHDVKEQNALSPRRCLRVVPASTSRCLCLCDMRAPFPCPPASAHADRETGAVSPARGSAGARRPPRFGCIERHIRYRLPNPKLSVICCYIDRLYSDFLSNSFCNTDSRPFNITSHLVGGLLDSELKKRTL